MKISEMVNEFAETTKQTPSRKLSLNLIYEEYLEFLDEARKTRVNRPYELKELADLIYVIYGYARVQGYDLDGAVEAVHENNLGRIRQPDGSIKRREDGKILKNPDYPKVNLNDYIGS